MCRSARAYLETSVTRLTVDRAFAPTTPPFYPKFHDWFLHAGTRWISFAPECHPLRVTQFWPELCHPWQTVTGHLLGDCQRQKVTGHLLGDRRSGLLETVFQDFDSCLHHVFPMFAKCFPGTGRPTAPIYKCEIWVARDRFPRLRFVFAPCFPHVCQMFFWNRPPWHY